MLIVYLRYRSRGLPAPFASERRGAEDGRLYADNMPSRRSDLSSALRQTGMVRSPQSSSPAGSQCIKKAGFVVEKLRMDKYLAVFRAMKMQRCYKVDEWEAARRKIRLLDVRRESKTDA